MIARTSLQSLKSFQEEAQSNARLGLYAAQMAMLQDRIATESPESVLWAAAFGSFLDLRDRPPSARTSPRQMDVLVITNEKTAFDAYLLLGEKVFGPVLIEFGRLPSYIVWTRSDLKAAMKADDETLKKLRHHGVTIYGSPPVDFAVA